MDLGREEKEASDHKDKEPHWFRRAVRVSQKACDHLIVSSW